MLEGNIANAMVGGAAGKHHYCPKDAHEAHQVKTGFLYFDS